MSTPPLGISSCWRSAQAESAGELCDLLGAAGLDNIELEYRVTTAMYADLQPILKAGAVKVLSIHNPFPLPPRFPRDRASGDLLNLASDDPEERAEAVKLAVGTLERANDMETDRVVLHCGYVDLEPLGKDWRARFGDGEEDAKEELALRIRDRAVRSPAALDRLKFSLEKTLARAEKLDVKVGLENRDWPREIPDITEMGDLLGEFDGAPLGFWFDVGHAAKVELYGLCSSMDWLDRYGSRLLGVHLHDAEGFRDHMPPGRGKLDLKAILKRVREAGVWILEIGPDFSNGEVRESIEHIRALAKEE